MALQFPNHSRSYNKSRQCVRFWAYDEVLEITFFVDADVFCRASPAEPRSEEAVLDAFDLHRDRICAAAKRIYSRHDKASYVLTAADCQIVASQ